MVRKPVAIAWLFGTAAVLAAPTLAQAQAAQEPGALEEIVVMAQRRAENLQSVPVAVTALTAESAKSAGITDTTAIQQLVPGLQINRSSNNNVTFIRGVGTAAGTVGNEPSVATFIDDVYILQNNATIFEFNSVESIAVLRGPQGTLFGRNATGGAIQIFTKDPGPTPQVDMDLGYGNYNTVSGNLYASTPISDTLAVNFSGHFDKQHDGWGKNINNNEDVFKSWGWGVRGKVVWTPTDATRVRLSVDAGKTWDQQGVNVKPLPGAYAFGCAPPTAACRLGYEAFGGFYNTGALHVDTYTGGALAGTAITLWPEISDGFSAAQQGGSLKVDHDFGALRVVSISAYRNTDFNFSYDQDGGPVVTSDSHVKQRDRNWTQEVQILSPDDSRIQWIVGGFYLNDLARIRPYANRGNGRNGNILVFSGRQKSTSIAVFGQATMEVLPRTNVTLGLRNTKDKRAVAADFYSQTTAGAVVSRGVLTPASDSWSKLTYRASIDHKFSDDLMAYASFNRGFKSGVFNFLSPPGGAAPTTGAFQTPAPGPEILDAYEVGVKSQLLDNRLRLNGAAFYYDYSNLQVQSVATGVVRTLNAANATVKGLEGEATFAATSNLDLNAAFSLQKGTYKEFLNGPHNVPRGNTTPPSCANQVYEPSSPGGNVSASPNGCNLSGNDTIRTPRFSATVGGVYTIETSAGDVAIAAHASYTGKFYWEPDNSVSSKSRTLLNGSIRWSSPNGRYDVRLWGKNLGGVKYYSYASPAYVFSPAPPRTFGVTFGTHWGG